jgi:hypothetical protein
VQHALCIVELDPSSDPPKVITIGPDVHGNLLEVSSLELEAVELIIHAMPLRPKFHSLLRPETPT